MSFNQLFLSLFITTVSLSVFAQPSIELRTKMATLGNIKLVEETEDKGIYAWTIEKQGSVKVFYTTPDEQYFFAGPIWNTNNHTNISNNYNLKASKFVTLDSMSLAQQSMALGDMRGSFNGPIPASLKLLDNLAGFKEQKADIKDTLYIIFDPRCPWCHAAYEKTRGYVGKGITIKWIPTIALGAPESGYPVAASIIQQPSSETLAKAFAKPPQITVNPTKQSIQQLTDNLNFLRLAIKESTGSDQAQVPVGFFLNRRNGQAKMIMGLSEDIVLNSIFGK